MRNNTPPTRARQKTLQTPPGLDSTYPCWLQPWMPSLPRAETHSSYWTPPLKLSSLPCSKDTSRSLQGGEWERHGSGPPMA